MRCARACVDDARLREMEMEWAGGGEVEGRYIRGRGVKKEGARCAS